VAARGDAGDDSIIIIIIIVRAIKKSGEASQGENTRSEVERDRYSVKLRLVGPTAKTLFPVHWLAPQSTVQVQYSTVINC